MIKINFLLYIINTLIIKLTEKFYPHIMMVILNYKFLTNYICQVVFAAVLCYAYGLPQPGLVATTHVVAHPVIAHPVVPVVKPLVQVVPVVKTVPVIHHSVVPVVKTLHPVIVH